MSTIHQEIIDRYTLASAKDLNPLIRDIGSTRYVLLGEASHGTHKYYTWRAAITKRLIETYPFGY